jgi:hypothetical protein
MTLNVTKYCNHLLTKLIKTLMLKKWWSQILTFLLNRREGNDIYYVKTKYKMHQLIFIMFISVTLLQKC